MVAGGGDADASRRARRCACRRRSCASTRVPDGFVEVAGAAAASRRSSAAARRARYGEAPYVEEWKPLPPRLHDFVEVERDRRRAALRDRASAR